MALDRGRVERAYREFPHTADAAKMWSDRYAFCEMQLPSNSSGTSDEAP